MFSPVYEDVSGLFGRQMPMTNYATPTELQFAPSHISGMSRSQSPPQQQQQQQQQQARPTYTLVDAAGNVIAQQPSMNAPQSGMQFNSVNTSSIIPFELFLQQQQQQQQQQQHMAALAGKPTAFQTADGVKYFISASPNSAAMMAAGGNPANMAMLRQQQGSAASGGPTLFAMDPNNAQALLQSTNFFQAAGNPHHGAGGSGGDFPFFVANGMAAAGPMAMNGTGIIGFAPEQHPSALINSTTSLNMQANVNRNQTVAELLGNKSSIEVFDPYFKYIYDVPAKSVVHLPPARLNITRLVLCRNYRPYESQSCAMGGNCKFVHADCDYSKLEAHPIHVNYIWRQESLCTYPLLSAGNKLRVKQSDGAVVEVPSERLLVTRGATESLASSDKEAVLVSCDAYENNGMCYQGNSCSYAHVIVIDPFVQGDFKRAPRKRDVTGVNSGHNFSLTTMQRSPSTASGEHSHSQAGQPALPPPPLPPQHHHQHSNSLSQSQATPREQPQARTPDSERSDVSGPVRSAAAQPVSAESVLSSATLAKLLEAMAGQHTASGKAATGPAPAAAAAGAAAAASSSQQATAPSFGIALTPYAVQTLSNTASAGTLLFLPRGATEAVVVGPVGTTGAAKAAEAAQDK